VSKRWTAILLALVPGLGHLYLGRHWRGLGVFALFAFAVNAMFLAFEGLIDAQGSLRLFRCGAVAAWAYSVLHVALLSRQFDQPPGVDRKDYHFKRGLSQYLAGAFEAARDEFRAVLKLDPMDIDARFHLGMTLRAMGQTQQAVRAFRRCLADDVHAKWRWEVDVQMARMKGAG
jgi:tetratricopeptide (TPR) repeat protein